MNSDCVIIVGAGPVGLVAAVSLIQNKIPVIVLEASADLAVDLRASTFHPPTLDFLDELNLADGLTVGALNALCGNSVIVRKVRSQHSI